jgi:uncharacterized protein YxeA
MKMGIFALIGIAILIIILLIILMAVYYFWNEKKLERNEIVIKKDHLVKLKVRRRK